MRMVVRFCCRVLSGLRETQINSDFETLQVLLIQLIR